ncbi:MAG: PAS domain S-box protein, partial [Verrucomicrobiota bacterium]
GTILAVNRAWRDYARANSAGTANLSEGANYLNVCVAAHGPHSEEAAAFAAGFRSILRGDQDEFSFEYPCHSPDEKRWFNVRVTHFPGKDIHCLVAAHENITAQKQAEEALRESEVRMRSIAYSAQDAILMMDSAGIVSYWNPAAEHILGYTRAEAIGQNLHSFLVPLRYQAAHQGAFPTFRKTGQGAAVGKTLDLEARRKDGKEISVQISLSAIQISNDWHAVGILRDVTEHKRMENELRRAHNELEKKVLERTEELHIALEKYKVLFDSFPLGITVTDKAGNIVESNRESERLLDIPHNEQTTRKYDGPEWRIIRADGTPMPVAEYASVRAMQKNCRIENVQMGIVKDDEAITWINVTAAPIPLADFGVAIIYADMTDRKQAEQDRIAREAAEAATRAKSIFVANMSHEIRTPMNAILGFAQVLERDPTLTPLQVEHVRTITRNGEYLLRLINDILDISKIEAGRSTLNEAAFCLYDLLDDLEVMFRSRINARGLQFLMERDGSVPPYVVADEGKLRQVVVNLIGNAGKFTEMGGVTVRVRAEAVEGISGEDKEMLRLWVEVEDSGRGIPDEDMGRIFGLFQQVVTSVKDGGVGLGLAISRKFAEMMGGEITATSEVGRGSCFRFSALLKPAAAVAGREKPTSRRIVGLEPGTGPFRILVVDDVPANRALLCTLLRSVDGFEVAEASNGIEALEVFERWSPHAVLMDMRMPVMDGYEATRRIKATEAGCATPVIAVTAGAFDDSKQQFMAAGVDAYLIKPFNVTELFETLGKCLDLRYVSAAEAENFEIAPAAPSLISAAPIALPQELVQAMRQAVEECDIERLTEQIVQAGKFNSDAARELQALSDRYDFAKLGQWLEKRGIDND